MEDLPERGGFSAAEVGAMRIGLVDVDGHNYPNLPLMKLSAWHLSLIHI